MGNKKSIPSSIFSRGKTLLGTALKVGTKEIVHRVSKNNTVLSKQIAQAEIIVESLSRLKGAAMKTGQLLSLDATDFLPQEVVKIFSKLQNSSPHFMPIEEVKKILHQELGENYAKIENISSKPIAAASIGQVHLAKMGNQNLAIKVQYPGVANSVDADIALLKQLVETYLKLSNKKINSSAVFEELKTVLKQEVDYNFEAQTLEHYRKLCDAFDYYYVPKVFQEISSPKVLSMSFESGIPLKEWIQSNPPQEAKDKIGTRLLELYCREFFDWGKVQTDPNQANFLVHPEDLSLVLLDFGALKTFSPEFILQYKTFVNAVYKKKNTEALKISHEMGFIKAEESDATKEAFLVMVSSSLEAINPNAQPFDFSDARYFERSKETSLKFTNMLEHTAPPHKILFLHRKLAGIYSTLRKLEVKQDLSEYWHKWIELK